MGIIQCFIDILRGKRKFYYSGNKLPKFWYRALKLIIFGSNNKIYTKSSLRHCKIYIYGNNNKIIISKKVNIKNLEINIGAKNYNCNNTIVYIGENTEILGAKFVLMEDFSHINIGKNCLFSTGINLWCSDTHSIIDNTTQKITNIGHSVIIGNNVWCGLDVKICKNTIIPSNSVIGWGSVITKKFNKSNCIIAGNPAKVVKQNISWNKQRPKLSIK